MILPDVNVLVNAFRRDTDEHALCRRWLESVVNGDSRYGMSPQVLSGVIRVATHPRVFSQPSGLDEVIRFCELLMDEPHCALIGPGQQHWSIFSRLCRDAVDRETRVLEGALAFPALKRGDNRLRRFGVASTTASATVVLPLAGQNVGVIVY